MQFKRLTINDYSEIISLWSRAGLLFKPKGRDSRDSIAGQMIANPDFFIGAFEKGCLIGTVILSSDMRRGWINRLAVDPCQRRRGVAKALIKESERIFRSRGLKIFCSLIESTNEASKAVFKQCGYGEHPDVAYFSKRESEMV